MGALEALDRYRRYVDVLDEYAARLLDQEEYLDLLTPGEVVDLLCTRDELETLRLDPEQVAELARLDDLIVKHHRVIAWNLPSVRTEPRAHWWWHLHEGPQVRAEALAAAPER